MKLLKKFICLNVLGALTMAPLAMAEGTQKEESKEGQSSQKEEAKAGTKKLRQVQGTIIEHKTVNFFKDKKSEQQAQKGDKAAVDKAQKSLVVLVKTDKGSERMPMDLGLVEYLPEIKDGETKIQAEGRVVEVGNKQLFVAKRVKIGDKTIEIKRS